MRRRDLLCAFVVLGCTVASSGRAQAENVQRLHAGAIEATLRVSPTHLTTAGRVVAKLEVAAPTAATIELIPPEPQPMGQFTVASVTRNGPTVVRPGWFGYELTVTLTPFLGGNYDVPVFTVEYHSPTETGRLVTKPVPVVVQSVLAGEDPAKAEPAGIVAIDELPAARSWVRWKWLDAVVFVIAVAGWLVFRRARREVALAAPGRGPFASALAALETGESISVGKLEHVIETLRAHEPEPVPGALLPAYERIRFGHPTTDEIREFSRRLKDYLRERAGSEPPGAQPV